MTLTRTHLLSLMLLLVYIGLCVWALETHASPQTVADERTVALVFASDGHVEVMRLSDAEALYDSNPADPILRAALVRALQTVPCSQDEIEGRVQNRRTKMCQEQRRAHLL